MEWVWSAVWSGCGVQRGVGVEWSGVQCGVGVEWSAHRRQSPGLVPAPRPRALLPVL